MARYHQEMPYRILSRPSLIVVGILAALFALEAALRLTHLELRYLAYTLYYSNYDAPAYRHSESAELIFSPRPGSFGPFAFSLRHARETDKKAHVVTNNSLGFRSPEWSQKKPSGVFRIFVFGGSNAYGASVSDEQTFPARLQRLLDREAPGKFQVWNGGITAAVLSQAVTYARYAAESLSPDLVLIQDFYNAGRRPFLHGQGEPPLELFFTGNPELYAENIPLLISVPGFVRAVHEALVMRVAVYRFLLVLLNNRVVSLDFPHQVSEGRSCQGSPELCGRIERAYSEYGQRVSDRELGRFRKDYPSLPVLLFDPVKGNFCGPGPHSSRGVPAFSLCPAGKPDEYRAIHPPSYVYEFYAEEILRHLKKQGLLSIRR